MRNNVKLFVPVVLAILIGSLIITFAQTRTNAGKSGSISNAAPPPRGDGFHPGGGIPPQILNQLNLTDAQKTQISALQDAARTASQTYFETIRTADDQLRTLATSGTFNEAQARQILATKTQAEIELEIIRLRTDAAIYNLLTAEQKALFVQLQQQMPLHGGRSDMPPQQE